jgi:hypothetical protein
MMQRDSACSRDTSLRHAWQTAAKGANRDVKLELSVAGAKPGLGPTFLATALTRTTRVIRRVRVLRGSKSNTMAAKVQKMRWGDALDDEEALPPTTVRGPDENGVKTIIEYYRNDKGDAVKKISKVKSTVVEKKVYKASCGCSIGPATSTGSANTRVKAGVSRASQLATIWRGNQRHSRGQRDSAAE